MVTLHVAAKRWYSTPVSTSKWEVMNVYDSLVRWCVPVFFMLSGMIFLDPARPLPGAKLYGRMLPRLGISLVFWNAAYGLSARVMRFILYGTPFSARDALKIVAAPLIGFYWYHLWFIYPLAGFYLIAPYLRKISAASSRREIEGLLVTTFVLGSMLPFGAKLLGREFPFKPVELSGYLGYFFAGHYIEKYGVPRHLRKPFYVSGALSACAIWGLTSFLSRKGGTPVAIVYDYLSPFTVAASVAVFAFFKHEVSRYKFEKSTAKRLARLASLSFGVYLIHDFANQLLAILGITTLSLNPLLSIPLFSGYAAIAGFAGSALIQKISFARGWLN